VSRRIDEGDPPAAEIRLIGGDPLGDPPGLLLSEVGVTDRIEEGRLPVIDVAEDRYDRRPRDPLLGSRRGFRLRLFFLRRGGFLFVQVDDQGVLVLVDRISRLLLVMPSSLAIS